MTDSHSTEKALVCAPTVLTALRKPTAKADLIALPLTNASAPMTGNQNEGLEDNGDPACTTIQLSAK